MADTKIQWTNKVWNPVRGCSIVSKGCTNCYAMKQAHRFSGAGGSYEGLTKLTNGGPVWTGDIRLVPEKLDEPLRWTKPRMIFVNSMSDLFHEDISDDFIEEVFAVMALADKHIFQVLTKRPERMRKFLNTEHRWVTIEGRAQRIYHERTGDDPSMWLSVKLPLPNVWLGVSVENQETADERIPLLLETPAAVRWLSCEPLLGLINIQIIENNGDLHDQATRGSYWRPLIGSFTDSPTIHWVVVGGESGPKARPMEIAWAKHLKNQCSNAGVPFFMKQGSQANWPNFHNIEAFPKILQVREYPNA